MNRERLAVEVAGIRMATPIMGASGTFGFGMEYEDFLDLADVGAVVSKGITPKPHAMRFSNDTSQESPALRARRAMLSIIGSGPQTLTACTSFSQRTSGIK